MAVIKSFLKEELHNAELLKKEYKEKLKHLHAGSFIKKQIKDNIYFYLAFREGDKVRFIYKGKKLSKADKEENKKAKMLRLKYKENIRKLDKRIKYIRKVLNGKEDV